MTFVHACQQIIAAPLKDQSTFMNILFPSDFSYNANSALMYAAEVCKFTKGTLTLVHAVHVPMVDSGAVPVVEEMMDGLKQNAEKNMKGLVELLKREQGIQANVRIEFGFAADVIIDAARQTATDLIVMGTKGASNLVDRVFGSITAEVMRRTDVPLLIVPQHALFKGLEKIAVSTGLKKEDIALAKRVREFCDAFDPEVILIHVEQEGEDEAAVESFVKMIEQEFPEAGFAGFQSDSVAEGLDEFVDLENMQLLAIRREKRNFLENLFHKSVTRELAYHGKVPTLVFHD